jgi:hypothetical protein
MGSFLSSRVRPLPRQRLLVSSSTTPGQLAGLRSGDSSAFFSPKNKLDMIPIPYFGPY